MVYFVSRDGFDDVKAILELIITNRNVCHAIRERLSMLYKTCPWVFGPVIYIFCYLNLKLVFDIQIGKIKLNVLNRFSDATFRIKRYFSFVFELPPIGSKKNTAE